jgi:general secretion pathway protein D
MSGSGRFAVSALAWLLGASLAAAQPPPQPVTPAPLAQPPQQQPQPVMAPPLTQSAQRITPNFKDADITQIAEAVAAATGKNFIIDPRVRAQVTMLSSTPMSPPAFYEAFLSILEVYGFIAVPAGGNVVKILPDANARSLPGLDLPDHVNAGSDEIVTQVLDVRNVSAPQLVPILRPMVPQYGHLVAVPSGNILIITDHASNVARLTRIIRRIDQVGNQDPEIVTLTNASASEIVRVVNSLYQGAAATEGVAVKVVADERSNSVLVAGDEAQRLRIRALIAHLDTPLESGGDTRVRYLHYADAEKLAPKLKEQITGIAQASASPTAGGGAAQGGTVAAAAEKNAMVWADPTNNALIITAPPKIMHAVMDIIDKLDIRRPQVLVEAIIADVDFDKDAELGVNWAAFANGSNVPAGAFVSPVGGTSIVDLAGAIENPASATTTLLQGTTIGIGKVNGGTGLNFAAVLRAIRSDTDDNVIATPSAVTMDNQEAELKVAQEVPFITGQYTNSASNTGGITSGVNPFQTIQREEVGTILKITPTISAEGTQVMLKISIESSSIGVKPAGAVDLVTNKRTVTTTVMIEDGGIVVLGGLIENDYTKGENRVPYLGNIPIIGLLFKTRSESSTKNNLMIFIRPQILRDGAQAAYQTDLKYNYMRDQQKGLKTKEILPLLPGVSRGQLPELPQGAPGDQAPPLGQSGAAPAAAGASQSTVVAPEVIVPTPALSPPATSPPSSNPPPAGSHASGATVAPAPGSPAPQSTASPAASPPPPPQGNP